MVANEVQRSGKGMCNKVVYTAMAVIVRRRVAFMISGDADMNERDGL
jgi:hypothetical protein